MPAILIQHLDGETLLLQNENTGRVAMIKDLGAGTYNLLIGCRTEKGLQLHPPTPLDCQGTYKAAKEWLHGSMDRIAGLAWELPAASVSTAKLTLEPGGSGPTLEDLSDLIVPNDHVLGESTSLRS